MLFNCLVVIVVLFICLLVGCVWLFACFLFSGSWFVLCLTSWFRLLVDMLVCVFGFVCVGRSFIFCSWLILWFLLVGCVLVYYAAYCVALYVLDFACWLLVLVSAWCFVYYRFVECFCFYLMFVFCFVVYLFVVFWTDG